MRRGTARARQRSVATAATAGSVVAALVLIASAYAVITATRSAPDLAGAIATEANVVTGASFVTIPPSGSPTAVSTTPLAGFPTHGGSYTILTTGDATIAGNPNDAASSGASIGGGNVRGDTDFDVTILKIDVNVPAGRNCLRFDFR